MGFNKSWVYIQVPLKNVLSNFIDLKREILGGPQKMEQSIFQDFALINSYFFHLAG